LFLRLIIQSKDENNNNKRGIPFHLFFLLTMPFFSAHEIEGQKNQMKKRQEGEKKRGGKRGVSTNLEELESRFEVLGLLSNALAAVYAARVFDGLGSGIFVHLHAHGADILQKGVQVLVTKLLRLQDAESLVARNRFHEGTKRADEAAEETRNVQRRNDGSHQQSHLHPSGKASGSKDICVPHHHPREVGEQSARGREHGEGGVGKHSERVLLSCGGTAPADKDGR